MKILVNSDQVIVDIVDTTEVVENGLLLTKGTDQYVFAHPEQFTIYDATVPTGVTPQKYKYDGTTFSVNPNYVLSPAEELAQMKKDLYTPQTPVDVYNSINTYTATLADLKAAKINALDYLSDQTLNAGFVSTATGTSITYGWTDKVQKQLLKVQMAIDKGVDTFPIDYEDINRNIVTLVSQTVLTALDLSASTFEWAQVRQLRSLVNNVLSATTNSQVDVVQWSAATY